MVIVKLKIFSLVQKKINSAISLMLIYDILDEFLF